MHKREAIREGSSGVFEIFPKQDIGCGLVCEQQHEPRFVIGVRQRFLGDLQHRRYPFRTEEEKRKKREKRRQKEDRKRRERKKEMVSKKSSSL